MSLDRPIAPTADDLTGLPPQEARRLEVLRELGVLDTLPEPVFDAIVASAARACGVPMATISLIDLNRQWFKARIGLEALETPREVAFCDHAIRSDHLMEVPDATRDERFAANPLVTGHPDVRFYAGAPIRLEDGSRVGTVCVIDRVPRALDDRQRETLESLAAIVASLLDQRRRLLQATGRLAESELRQRRLYQASPAILHSVGPDGRILDVSDRWLALMGYERDEVVGRLSSDFLSEASQRRARQVVLPEFFRTGRCDRVEYQFVHRDGHLIDVLLTARLERDDQGNPLRSAAVLEDVSASKRLQAELDRTAAHLDAVFDNMPALAGYWDGDAVTRFVNRDFQAAVGLPADRLVGCGLAQVVAAVDPVGYEAIAPRVAAVLDGRRQEFECALLTTSGLRQLRVTFVPAQPEDGRVGGFYGTFFDITGMKALELRQRESEHRYRLLFDHLASAHALHAVILDEAGKPVDYRFLAMNPAFAELTGLDPATTINARATEVFPHIATDPADWIGRFGRVALTGEPAHIEQQSASGRWWDMVVYRPAPGQFAVIAREVSHVKRLERELERAQAQVRELQARLAGAVDR
ncbi:MAG: PAS domain-containing protein [Burkholderiaceae bacterium]